MSGLGGIMRRAIPALVGGIIAVGSLGIAPAGAHGAGLPWHEVMMRCDGINHITLDPTAFGYNRYVSEPVHWTQRLQQWDGQRWVTIKSRPWDQFMSSWYKPSGELSMGGLLAQVWELTGTGGWFRVQSWFYWKSTGAMTQTETTNPCYLAGFILA